MSKNERNRLYDIALENGWAEPDVNAAYFDAAYGMDDELIRLAETTPESESDE